MSRVRNKGRMVEKFASPGFLEYRSPGCTFECEKILNNPKELAKLSGEVITYKKGEIL